MALEHKDLTGAQLHEPKGVEDAVSGTVYVADGAGSGDWADPLVSAYSFNKFAMEQRLDDLAAPSSAYFNIPWKSELQKVNILLYGTLDADTTVTVLINGVLFADSLVIAAAGTAAGQRKTLTVVTSNTITAGSIVTITTDGAATATVRGEIQLELEKVA
jgi:hypothetical protein